MKNVNFIKDIGNDYYYDYKNVEIHIKVVSKEDGLYAESQTNNISIGSDIYSFCCEDTIERFMNKGPREPISNDEYIKEFSSWR